MKKFFFIIITFLAVLNLVHAQTQNDIQIIIDIQKLTRFKWDYEKFEKMPLKRDSILMLYKNHVSKIKKSPEVYLKYINYALKNQKIQLSKESSPYKYISGLLSTFDKNSHFIKEIDLYRIIKYYLFKRNDELLPESFRGLPVVDEKNYIKQYTPKPGESRAAVKFLRKNLSLSNEELKFIKNKYNIKDVADMKKYLDDNGLSSENKDFIKWAIDYLIKRSWVSLGWLENVYNTGSQNTLPRDREP